MDFGYEVQELMNCTPRTLMSRLHFAAPIQKQNHANAIAAAAMGARGDPRAVKKQIKDLAGAD